MPKPLAFTGIVTATSHWLTWPSLIKVTQMKGFKWNAINVYDKTWSLRATLKQRLVLAPIKHTWTRSLRTKLSWKVENISHPCFITCNNFYLHGKFAIRGFSRVPSICSCRITCGEICQIILTLSKQNENTKYNHRCCFSTYYSETLTLCQHRFLKMCEKTNHNNCHID